MRLVDEAEVALEPVEHGGVRVQQGLVAGEHRLEHRLPPGEFELGGDASLGHVALRQVGSSGSRPRSRSRPRIAVRSCRFGEHLGLGGEAREGVVSSRTGRDASWRGVPVTPSGASRLGEVVRHALVGHVHVVDADRHTGDRAGLDVPLPQRALLLDAAERVVHVGDVDARAQVLEGVAAKAAAVGARHLGESRRGDVAAMSSTSERS